eukprot:2873370-Prymnesium_polylepis.1
MPCARGAPCGRAVLRPRNEVHGRARSARTRRTCTAYGFTRSLGPRTGSSYRPYSSPSVPGCTFQSPPGGVVSEPCSTGFAGLKLRKCVYAAKAFRILKT